MSAVSLQAYPVAPARRHLQVVPDVAVEWEQGDATRVRITRRGRLALTLATVMSLLVVATAIAVWALPSSASTQVVVEPGQTLSQIAATHLPQMPLDRAIVQVQVANDMNSLQVQAGQTLQLP